VEIQAQSDGMALAALKDLTITSTDGRIILNAAKEIWIGAGGSYIQINGSGITNGSPGSILEKGASWDVPGPASMELPLPPLPTVYEHRFDRPVWVVDDRGYSIPDRPVRVHLKSGQTLDGKTDHEGKAQLATSDEADILRVEVLKKPSGKNT
ncbi:DUF2345 domain-containing protein, partial [Paraburkholderia sediminicola]